MGGKPAAKWTVVLVVIGCWALAICFALFVRWLYVSGGDWVAAIWIGGIQFFILPIGVGTALLGALLRRGRAAPRSSNSPPAPGDLR